MTASYHPCVGCDRKQPARSCAKECEEIKAYDKARIEVSRKRAVESENYYITPQVRACKNHRESISTRVKTMRERNEQAKDTYNQRANKEKIKRMKQEENNGGVHEKPVVRGENDGDQTGTESKSSGLEEGVHDAFGADE